MDVDLIVRTTPFFLQAALITVVVSALSLVLGLAMGFGAALAKLSANPLLRHPANAYVSVIRGTPALIQIFLIYFGGPQVGIHLDAFTAGILGLGINIGAYMTESIRGAIVAVAPGQADAARALGFRPMPIMALITLPQAARLMIRPLGINAIALVKGSALVSAISVVELTYTAQRYLSSTYQPLEIFLVSGSLYLAIVTAMIWCIDRLDERYALKTART
ncbi:MAG TPA: amino acid ABC transporter permease [Methylomirabilota bacterium]|nr:amino acid ABC transporter permease [Methylomirabilota bacterium]